MALSINFFLEEDHMASIALDFESSKHFNLKNNMDRLALEAEYVQNIIGLFKEIIPKLTNIISDISGSFSKHTDDSDNMLVKNIEKNLTDFNKLEDNIKFIDYNKTLVIIPEGFTGKFVDYLKVLNSIMPEVYKEAHAILGEYNLILSSFITNKDQKTSIKDHTQIYKKATEKRLEFTKKLSVFTNDKSASQSRDYLGKVIDRFADLNDIVKELKTLTKDNNKQNLEQIKKSTDQCVELLNMIVKSTSDNSINNVSGTAAKNIADGAYEIGKYVEFVSIYRFKTEQVIKVMDLLVVALLKFAK